jgi:hypothetical protein
MGSLIVKPGSSFGDNALRASIASADVSSLMQHADEVRTNGRRLLRRKTLDTEFIPVHYMAYASANESS